MGFFRPKRVKHDLELMGQQLFTVQWSIYLAANSVEMEYARSVTRCYILSHHWRVNSGSWANIHICHPAMLWIQADGFITKVQILGPILGFYRLQ